MRRALVALASIACSVFAASSAHADHVVDIVSDGRCRAGGEATGIGVDLFTSDIKFRMHRDGWVKSYTCRFDNVPTYVPPAYEGGPDWTLPTRKLQILMLCWRNPVGEEFDGLGTLTIKPNGTAVITCTFSQ